jgi:hypothetical protein
MALSAPVPSKDWRISSNNLVGNASNGTSAFRNFWWTLVDMFVNPSNYTWRDMTGAVRSGTPGTDIPIACTTGSTSTWSTEAGLVCGTTYNTNPHSWYVLGFPGIGAGFQLLLDLTGTISTAWQTFYVGGAGTPSSTTAGGMYVSTSVGFSGATGSSIRPFASDETPYLQKCFGSGAWAFTGLSATTGWRGRLHMMRAVDGTCNRVVFYYNNVALFYMLLDVAQNPFVIGGGTDIWNSVNVPWVGCGVYSQSATTSILVSTGANSGLLQNAGTGTPWCSRITNAAGSTANRDLWPIAPYVFFTSGPAGYVQTATAPDDIDYGWPVIPIALGCFTTGYRQVRAGSVFDFFLTPSVLNNGDYTQDANYCWAVMGETLQPWDRTVMQTMV